MRHWGRHDISNQGFESEYVDTARFAGLANEVCIWLYVWRVIVQPCSYATGGITEDPAMGGENRLQIRD